MSDGVLSVLQAKFDAVFGKLSPEPQLIFRRCFFARQGFQAAAVYAYRKAQETQFYRKLSPNLKSFFGDVFSQDKENKRWRTVGTPSEI